MAQVKIEKLFVNDIVTKFGEKKKYDVYILTQNGEFKFHVWQGQWNNTWQQGTMIDVPDITDSRWKKQDWQGKTNYTLGAPPEAMHDYSGQAPQQQALGGSQSFPTQQNQPQGTLDPNQAFGTRMNAIEEDVQSLKKEVMDLSVAQNAKEQNSTETDNTEQNNDIPVITEEVSLPGVAEEAKEEIIDLADIKF